MKTQERHIDKDKGTAFTKVCFEINVLNTISDKDYEVIRRYLAQKVTEASIKHDKV
jgi:hypothetical protein